MESFSYCFTSLPLSPLLPPSLYPSLPLSSSLPPSLLQSLHPSLLPAISSSVTPSIYFSFHHSLSPSPSRYQITLFISFFCHCSTFLLKKDGILIPESFAIHGCILDSPMIERDNFVNGNETTLGYEIGEFINQYRVSIAMHLSIHLIQLTALL